MVSILPPYHRIKGLPNGKGSSKVWKEKGCKWFCHFFLSIPFLFLFLHYFCVFLSCFESIEFYALLCLTCFCLFTFQFCFILFFPYKIKKKNCKIRKIQKQYVFVYSGTCVPWMAIKTKFSKLCIFFNLDEFLYAQLSKWALWLVFVMSKIK